MTSVIKSFLQTELFDGEKELIFSLISFRSGENPAKGSKQNIIVLAAKTYEPFTPSLYLIRLNQKNKIKRQYNILLSDVSNVYVMSDFLIKFQLRGKNPLIVGCADANDQKDFLDSLWQASQSFLTVRPTFHGYSPAKVSITVTKKVEEDDPEKILEASRQAEKRSNEERQLLNLLRKFHFVVFSVEFLVQKLDDSTEESVWTILESVVESETRRLDMLNQLDDCLAILDDFEDFLNISEMAILDLGTQLKELEMVDTDREYKMKNQSALLEELSNLVNAYDLSNDVAEYIDNGKIGQDNQKTSSIISGLSLTLLTHVDEAVKTIPSIRIQMDMVFDKSLKFVGLVARYLQDEIKAYENQFILLDPPKEIAILNHFSFHKKLKTLLPNIEGLKILNATLFTETYTCYCTSFKKIYEKQVRDLVNVCISQITSCVSNKTGSNPFKLHKDVVVQKFDENTRIYLEESRMLIDQFFDLVEQLILKDVKFALEFLLFSSTPGEEKKISQHRSSDFSQRLNLKIKTMINTCFGFLEKELKKLYDWVIKKMPILVVYMYHKSYMMNLRSEQYVYMTQTYQHIENLSRTYLNNFFSGIKQSICSLKVSKKIDGLSVTNGVRNFEDIIRSSDCLLKGAEKYGKELEAQFSETLISLYEYFDKQIKDNDASIKTEAFILENNFYIENMMKRVKAGPLIINKKSSRFRYKYSIEKFVQLTIRDPFDIIRSYFEAIETSISRGIKANDIHIQTAHSLHQLAKIAETYNLKELRKIIEGCSKIVGRHFGQSSMVLVIWTSFYEEITKMFKKYLDLYEKCYPKDNNVWSLKLEDVQKLLNEVNLKGKS